MNRDKLRKIEFEKYYEEENEDLLDIGYFHMFVVMKDGCKEDRVYAVVENEDGEVFEIRANKIKFFD